MEFSKELLAEFASYFPNLDFSGVISGYGQVERILVKHVKEFTPEQWKVITSNNYSYLFQDGTPHISWNTDRYLLVRELIRGQLPYRTWSETWYNCRKYSIRMGDTVLEITVEEPRTCSGRTHYCLEVAEKFIPVPTHRAAIIGIGSDTRAYIVDQFAGTEDECENWVAKNCEGKFFKIMLIGR